jgi:phage replication-related protein YjqB (UPF0714/DUF867 family)
LKKISLLLAVLMITILIWPATAQADVYKNFNQLKAHQDRNVDYRISYHNGPSSTAVIAIHGGQIEKGTSELAKEVAKLSGSDWYSFEGIKKGNNSVLHITSSRFDEPIGKALVAESTKTLSIHGCKRSSKITYVGGRDKQLAAKVKASLKKAGFTVGTAPDNLNGDSKYNICNRNAINKGVQLEISTAQRNAFFSGGEKTKTFYRFAEALAEAL